MATIKSPASNKMHKSPKNRRKMKQPKTFKKSKAAKNVDKNAEKKEEEDVLPKGVLATSDIESDDVDQLSVAETTLSPHLLQYFQQQSDKAATASENEAPHFDETNESNFAVFEDLEDDNEHGRSTYEELLKNIDNLEDFSVLRSQLETLKSEKLAVEEPQGFYERQKSDRGMNYKYTKQNVTKKWIPIIKSITESETLQLGVQKGDGELSIGQLVSSFKSADDFEKEIDAALVQCGISNSNLEASSELNIPAAPIKSSLERQQAQRWKALMFREHRRNKQLSRIRSKLWHKIKKKSDSREKEKLMSRLEVENPELAAQVRKEYEEKFATMRMMRRQNARKQWAKAALRFGGKDMQKTVAREKQAEYDERKAIEKIVRSGPRDMQSSDESDEGQDSDDEVEAADSKGDGTVASLTQKARLQAMRGLKHSYDPLPKKGLYALSFMKQAVEKQREAYRTNASELIGELDALEKGISSDNEAASEDDLKKGDKTDEASKQQGYTLPKFSKLELDDAIAEVEKRFNGNPNQHELDNASTSPSEALVKSNEALTQATTEESQSAVRNLKKLKSVNKNPWITKPTSKVSDKSGGAFVNKKSDGGNGIAHSDTNAVAPSKQSYDEMLSRMTVPGIPEEQQELITKSFVSSDDFAKSFSEEQGKQENEMRSEGADPNNLPGWGGWTGDGIINRKRKFKEQSQKRLESVTKSSKGLPVIINNKLDRKVAKYYVKQVPHPYKTKEEYEATLKHPIGHDWNVSAAHNRFIQPKVNVRIGAVVPPLEHAKLFPPKEAETLMNMWTVTKKHIHRTKARL